MRGKKAFFLKDRTIFLILIVLSLGCFVIIFSDILRPEFANLFKYLNENQKELFIALLTSTLTLLGAFTIFKFQEKSYKEKKIDKYKNNLISLLYELDHNLGVPLRILDVFSGHVKIFRDLFTKEEFKKERDICDEYLNRSPNELILIKNNVPDEFIKRIETSINDNKKKYNLTEDQLSLNFFVNKGLLNKLLYFFTFEIEDNLLIQIIKEFDDSNKEFIKLRRTLSQLKKINIVYKTNISLLLHGTNRKDIDGDIIIMNAMLCNIKFAKEFIDKQIKIVQEVVKIFPDLDNFINPHTFPHIIKAGFKNA